MICVALGIHQSVHEIKQIMDQICSKLPHFGSNFSLCCRIRIDLMIDVNALWLYYVSPIHSKKGHGTWHVTCIAYENPHTETLIC